MQSQTPPAGPAHSIYCLLVPSNTRLLLYHKSPEWTKSWLIKVRANGEQHKTAVCACTNPSVIAYESWETIFFFFLMEYKIWHWTLSKVNQCQALSAAEIRQMSDLEYADWQISRGSVHKESKELHLPKGDREMQHFPVTLLHFCCIFNLLATSRSRSVNTIESNSNAKSDRATIKQCSRNTTSLYEGLLWLCSVHS